MRANFESLIQNEKPLIVDFHALWCGPCKAQAPVLKEVANEMGEQVKIIKIDVDQNPEIANKFRIQSVPTLMIFKKGEVLYKGSGVHSKPQLINIIKNI